MRRRVNNWINIFQTLKCDPKLVLRPAGVSYQSLQAEFGLPAAFVSPGIPEPKKYPLLMGQGKLNSKPLSKTETEIVNDLMFNNFLQSEKKAVDAITDFTRKKLKEEGIFRKLMPPMPVPADMVLVNHQTNIDLLQWSGDDAVPGGITKETIHDALKVMNPGHEMKILGLGEPVTEPISLGHADVSKLPPMIVTGYSYHFSSDFNLTETVTLTTAEAIADAEQLTLAASNDEARAIAQSFWTQFQRQPRRPGRLRRGS